MQPLRWTTKAASFLLDAAGSRSRPVDGLRTESLEFP